MVVNKGYVVLAIAAGITLVYIAAILIYEPNLLERPYVLTDKYILTKHLHQNSPQLRQEDANWRHLNLTETERTFSTLGKIMYLNERIPDVVNSSRTYKILIWKYGPTIEKRHIYHFGKTKHNPFEECSVKNCVLTYDSKAISTADIVIIHLHRTTGLNDLPPREGRNSKQIWAFLSDESPYNTFWEVKSKLSAYNGIFNWSMTYKMNSDIPVPYGRVLLKNYTESVDLVKEVDKLRKTKRNDVLVAIMTSNCHTVNHRWKYVQYLQKHIKVDTYGHCGTLKCSGHFADDCKQINNYLFYLAFENSNCDDYLTEKLWWNAYHKNSIPVIMGASKDNLLLHLPVNSYITMEDFATPRDLANYLIYLNNTPSELLTYFQWKTNYTILNEHGYFQRPSRHYCRVCEALNYNYKVTKVYENLEKFISTNSDCYPPWDAVPN